ncbi:hypothetical protein JCM10213v2_003626 [Rhodosporidiobolus nylandii]
MAHGAMHRLKDFVNVEVAKTHPEDARKIAWEIRLIFIPLDDSQLGPDLPPPAADTEFYGFKR